MKMDEQSLDATLARLPAIEPHHAWERRVQNRCHQQLARHQRALRHRGVRMRLLEGLAAALLWAYLVTVVQEALRLLS